MNVFISINGLKCGGAEKSLISFLNEIPESYISENELKMDLLVLDKKDYFFRNVPHWVNWLETDNYIDGMFEHTSEHFKNPVNPIVLCKKLLAKAMMKLLKEKNATKVQHIWTIWKKFIPNQEKEYDIAISYVDGFSNYYVIDKVKAKKKILWVHNEYAKLNYNKNYDRKYFEDADAIVTISDLCIDSLKENFPELISKMWMIPNISSQKEIWNMAEKTAPDEYIGKVNKIVSIGRLESQKGFDMAIEVAKKLNTKIDFSWFILGEGELRPDLEKKIIEYNLQDIVFLLGNRSNPYVYIKNADIFVQPSRYEGKSIVLDEAKILEKPIVVTNYATVYDSITDGENGLIVKFDAQDISDKIETLLNSPDMQEKFRCNLKDERMVKAKDIYKYLELLDSVKQ